MKRVMKKKDVSGCASASEHFISAPGHEDGLFMFATGIENSYPTINGGKTRIDEMEICGHYKKWRTDFDLVEELGISFLRYGPPIHTTGSVPGSTTGPSPIPHSATSRNAARS